MRIKFRSGTAFILFLLVFNACFGQTVALLQQGKPTSIRGLSVVDDSIAWLSGSKGTVAITHNGGKTWDWQQVKGFEKADFRDIEAFSDKDAIIMSSGTPALILKTTDGGSKWQVKYKNTDTAYFFDAMDFADPAHGYVLGDPINGKFVLMETKSSGETWTMIDDAPHAVPGEAAFAASGTCLRVDDTGLIFVTGGSISRLIFPVYEPSKTEWFTQEIPLAHGKASQGAFSIAIDRKVTVIVGGDYSKDYKNDHTAFHIDLYSYSPEYDLAKRPPSGYQSCVEFISDSTFLSTGTPGSNITTDGGKTWKQIDTTSYNVCRKAKQGKLVLLAGNDGAIGVLKP